MTKLEKHVCGIVGLIIAFSIVVTLLISISLSTDHSEATYTKFADVGVKVLKNEVEKKQQELENTYKLWASQGQMTSALKNGYVGTLSEIYGKANIDENVFCMFTDAQGNIVWSSDNYKLTSYDVSLPLSFDFTDYVKYDPQKDEEYNLSGFYLDDSGNVSCIYAAPIVFGNQMLVGTCMIGCNLDAVDYLDNIKEQTGTDVAIFTADSCSATTIMDGSERYLSDKMSAQISEKVLTNGEVATDKLVIHGQNYFVHYEPFNDIYGNTAGAYFAGMPANESEAAVRTVIIISAIAAVVIISAAFAVMVIYMKNVVAKPIVAMSSLAENMSRGNLDVPDFETKFGNNEVGEFARSLENTKHSLALYIKDISQVLKAMAGGDFTAAPSVTYAGDFEEISRAFEDIKIRLSGIVRNINQSSEQVLSGSAKMASGSQRLASGTTTQASAIEELNTTVMSISDKISVNAENALHAKQLSASVEESAVEQNKDMSSVMEAMRDIEEKSSEISSIIKTIDDIAFQTNILALNAAVEAARAGAAGKGFAVVADEVRNLASKSAEAASNTTDLISATLLAVKDGSERVNAATASMLEITEKAKETSRLIDEISDASAEQAQSIKRVTGGIRQISDVVQQNSATAEETAASCEQLSGQSQILRNQIEMLKA